MIREKEGIIEQQKRQLGRYETSFRAVARLSLVVTGNKIKGAGRGVRKAGGWITRSGQKNKDKGEQQ